VHLGFLHCLVKLGHEFGLGVELLGLKGHLDSLQLSFKNDDLFCDMEGRVMHEGCLASIVEKHVRARLPTPFQP
jgi:hypothetical protein